MQSCTTARGGYTTSVLRWRVPQKGFHLSYSLEIYPSYIEIYPSFSHISLQYLFTGHIDNRLLCAGYPKLLLGLWQMHIFCLNASIFDDFGHDWCSILLFLKFVIKKIIFKTQKKKMFSVFKYFLY